MRNKIKALEKKLSAMSPKVSQKQQKEEVSFSELRSNYNTFRQKVDQFFTKKGLE